MGPVRGSWQDARHSFLSDRRLRLGQRPVTRDRLITGLPYAPIRPIAASRLPKLAPDSASASTTLSDWFTHHESIRGGGADPPSPVRCPTAEERGREALALAGTTTSGLASRASACSAGSATPKARLRTGWLVRPTPARKPRIGTLGHWGQSPQRFTRPTGVPYGKIGGATPAPNGAARPAKSVNRRGRGDLPISVGSADPTYRPADFCRVCDPDLPG